MEMIARHYAKEGRQDDVVDVVDVVGGIFRMPKLNKYGAA
jgi:hypothetical protein